MLMMVTTASALTWAHFPASYGRDFAIATETDPVAPAASSGDGQPTDAAERTDTGSSPLRTVVEPEAASPHQRLLADLEQQGGPFAAGLYEPLTMLGRLHRDSGDYRGAAALYRRALHTIRVNEGLLAEQQLPVLEELIVLYRKSGDWELLDQAYDDYLRVVELGAVASRETARRAVLAHFSWQREALRRGIDSDRNARLLALFDTTRRLLDEAAADPDTEQAWHRQLVFAQLDNLYLIVGELPVDEQVTGRSATGQRVGGVTRSPEYIRQRMTRIQQTAVGLGSDLLMGYLERWPDSTALETAQIWLALADWYQWNDKLQSAESRYRKVIVILRESGNNALLQQWFGQAAELPVRPVFLPRLASDDPPGPTTVRARFRVSARGNVSDIDIALADPERQGGAYGLRQMLRGTHFRPKMLADGSQVECVLSRDYRVFTPGRPR